MNAALTLFMALALFLTGCDATPIEADATRKSKEKETGKAKTDATAGNASDKDKDKSKGKGDAAAECGNGKVEDKELCDDGPDGSVLCTKKCAWAQCETSPGKTFKEDEYPLARCVYKKKGELVADTTCSTAGKPVQCFDCRGRLTSCGRVAPPADGGSGESASGDGSSVAEEDGSTDDDAAPPVMPALDLNDPVGSCTKFASYELALRGEDEFKVSLSPYRFGFTVDQAAFGANPDAVERWCVPPSQVNCAKWDADPGTWKAPQGCSCYAEGKGRSYENCNDVQLFACPWASGSGCGLHFLGEVGGIACTQGPDPRGAPHVNDCHHDVVGTMHDACCARHWYADKSAVFEGKNISEWECNGCNSGHGKQKCSATPLGIRTPRNTGLPCEREWAIAVDHNNVQGESRYQWFQAIDTEQRFTAAEVVEAQGKPEKLLARAAPAVDHLAPAGQIVLKMKDAAGVVDAALAARFCKSGQIAVESVRVGILFQSRDVWVCK